MSSFLPGSDLKSKTNLKIGGVSLALILLCLVWAIPLQCLKPALEVASVAILSGALMGFGMAMVTRTKNPWKIYFWLGVSFLSFIPLFLNFPAADESEIHLWKGAPSIVSSYFDLLRLGLYLLALPYPFAALGKHMSDYIQPKEDET